MPAVVKGLRSSEYYVHVVSIYNALLERVFLR